MSGRQMKPSRDFLPRAEADIFHPYDTILPSKTPAKRQPAWALPNLILYHTEDGPGPSPPALPCRRMLVLSREPALSDDLDVMLYSL